MQSGAHDEVRLTSHIWVPGALHWNETYAGFVARYCVLHRIRPRQFFEHFGDAVLSAEKLASITGECLEKCQAVVQPWLDRAFHPTLLRTHLALRVCRTCINLG